MSVFKLKHIPHRPHSLWSTCLTAANVV
jgi:hypothetical protein